MFRGDQDMTGVEEDIINNKSDLGIVLLYSRDRRVAGYVCKSLLPSFTKTNRSA